MPLNSSMPFLLIYPSKWKNCYGTELTLFPPVPFIHEVVERCQDFSIPRLFLGFFWSG